MKSSSTGAASTQGSKRLPFPAFLFLLACSQASSGHGGSIRRDPRGHRAEHAADDVPGREPGDELGIHQREEHRVPGAARTAGRDHLLDAQGLEHGAESLRAHVRLGPAVELDIRSPAVGPVPQQDALAAFRQGIGQFVHPAGVLAEPSARREDHDLAVLWSHELIDHDATVDLDPGFCHLSSLSRWRR
jgi:hypothetical protein